VHHRDVVFSGNAEHATGETLQEGKKERIKIRTQKLLPFPVQLKLCLPIPNI
jgi:hypothetical protein